MPVNELSMQETNWIEMQILLHIALFFWENVEQFKAADDPDDP